MRVREEREHEPCPHCGRNACSWHLPGRFCRYAYEDLPGQRPATTVTTHEELRRKFPVAPDREVA